MKWLLIGQRVIDFEIIGCFEDTAHKKYDIRYKCLRCGKVYNTHLIGNKVCIFRCDTCNIKGYIIPFIDKDSEEIVSYRVLDDKTYRKIRKQYKEVNIIDDFIIYIRDYFNKLE